MRRAGCLGLLAVVLSGCAGGRFKSGRATPETFVIEAVGRAPEDGSTAAAERAALGAMLDLFVSSGVRAEASGVIEKKILSKTTDYIAASKELDFRREGPLTFRRIRAEVRYAKLGADLESLGLVKPAPAQGEPRVSLSLSESGPGALRDAGRAAQSMRRALIARGYAVMDLSDGLAGDFKALGDPQKSEAEALKRKASVIVSGAASARSLKDERLNGYFASRAKISGSWKTPGGSAAPRRFEQEASAIDLAVESAGAKALENAGMLAGERIAEELARLVGARAEVSVVVAGISGFTQISELVEELRRLPEIAAVALGSLAPKRLRLRVYSDQGPDAVASALMRISSFSLRVVLVDAHYVELETAAGAGWMD